MILLQRNRQKWTVTVAFSGNGTGVTNGELRGRPSETAGGTGAREIVNLPTQRMNLTILTETLMTAQVRLHQTVIPRIKYLPWAVEPTVTESPRKEKLSRQIEEIRNLHWFMHIIFTNVCTVKRSTYSAKHCKMRT